MTDERRAIASITVMRGEWDRLPALRRTLAWVSERHIVETSPNLGADEVYEGFAVHHFPLPLGAPFDSARRAANQHVRAPWIFVVDTDERVPLMLADLIVDRLAEWDSRDIDGVWIPRQNHVFGRRLQYSSAWPDYQLRVIRRSAAEFRNRLHSGMPELTSVTRLPPDSSYAIQHYNFESTQDFVDKVNLYTSIEASQSPGRSSPIRAFIHALREFLARYVRMRGYRDGPFGFHYALLMSLYRYLIEAKRWEQQVISRRS